MRLATPLTALITFASLAACGSSPTPPATATATPATTPVAASTTTTSTPETSSTADIDDAETGLADALTGPVWWLSGASVDGQTVAVKESIFRRARLQIVDDFQCDVGECRDGLTLVGNDACNDFVSDVVLEGSTLTLGTTGESTMVDCDDQLTNAFKRVHSAPFEVAIEQADGRDQLLVTSADGRIELTFRTDADPFGPTKDGVVTSGTVGDVAYRITWEGPDGGGGTGGVLEFLDTKVTAFERNAIGIGISEEFPLDVNLHRFGDDPFLFGVAPIDAARVEFIAAGSMPVDLALFDVPDSDAIVFAEVITHGDEPWSVVSYDTDGAELGRAPR